MSGTEFREWFDECQTVRQVLTTHGRAWMDTGYKEAELRAAMTDAAEARISQLQHNESLLVDAELADDELAHDPVNHPKHYRHPSGVECITITEHMNFCIGNAMKYLWRADEKGNPVEDLQKARWYIDREIARRIGGTDA